MIKRIRVRERHYRWAYWLPYVGWRWLRKKRKPFAKRY